MSIPLWGQLQKAQDDPETIEEAISRLIAVHEADPEAHLGDGESLSEHKHETVIDHPQGSLLPDKISFSDLQFDTTFESLDGFTISSGVTNPSWPGAEFSIFDGGGDLRTLKMNLLGLLTGSTLTYDVMMDSYFYVDSADDNEIINIGISNDAMSTKHIGFRITDGQIYGYARWSGSEHLTSSLFNIPNGIVIFVRVFYDYSANVIYFYVNGELEGTLQPGAAVSNSDTFSVHCVDNAAESTILRLFRQTISRSI